MANFLFKHQGPVYMIYDDDFEIAYYVRNRKKYRRIRLAEKQPWSETTEEPVDDETFWIVVAITEMRG